MKNKILFFLLIISVMSFSQKKRSTKVGLTSIEELKLGYYDKDSTANALVLYEHANTYLSEKDALDFKTDFYYRIKLFTSAAFNRATVKVKLYKKEKIREIEAYSYNLENGTIVKTKPKRLECRICYEKVIFKIPPATHFRFFKRLGL